MAKTFTLCFEGDVHTPKFEMELPWDGNSTPDVIEVPHGALLVKVGRYLSAGDRYWYRRADIARVVGTALEGVRNDFMADPRPR